jgi:hypothetical protein
MVGVVIGGIEIFRRPRLHDGDPLFKVDEYESLTLALIFPD